MIKPAEIRCKQPLLVPCRIGCYRVRTRHPSKHGATMTRCGTSAKPLRFVATPSSVHFRCGSRPRA
jgi:hypothetical protein